MNPARIALVGPAHAVSPWLFAALRRHCVFEAVCDEHAERDAARHGARWTFTDIADMLREAAPTGVIIARPVRERPRITKQCLASGAGVLLSGYPGSMIMAQRISLYAKLSAHCVLAAPPVRFSPCVMLARRLLDSGKLTAPISMTFHSTRRGTPRGDLDDCGPVSVDQVFEAADVIQHLLGCLSRVTAASHADGVIVVAAESTDGVPVSIVLHASGPSDAVGIELQIRSSDGTCLTIDRNLAVSCGNGARVDAVHRPTLSMCDPAVELGFDGLMGEYVRLLRNGSAMGLVQPALQTSAVTDAILSSARKRRPMSVQDCPAMPIESSVVSSSANA